MSIRLPSRKHESPPAPGSGDPIWRIAFSTYYFMAGSYGLTAVITYDIIDGTIPVLASSRFGATLMLILGYAAMTGSVLRQFWGESENRRRQVAADVAAGVTTVTFIVGMLLYAAAIYFDVLGGDVMRLPAVLFPAVVGWFPLVAMIALVRTARRRP